MNNLPFVVFLWEDHLEWSLNLTRRTFIELYLVTTDQLESRIWFRDEEDFKAGMNAVAIISFKQDVNILSFALMSNHVHFVLESSYEQAFRFVNEFKRHHSRYLKCKYGNRETLRDNHVDIQRIDWTDESPERAIAYVQMNCVAANICLSPSDYPWGTGDSFFKYSPSKGVPIGTLSAREQRRLLHSKVELPGNYLVGNQGYILPESYVNVKFVESLYRNPKRMLFFLQNSSKAKKRLVSSDQDIPAFKDQTIIFAIPELLQSLFRKHKTSELSKEEMAELLKQLRFRFSANAHQIARVVGLSYEEAVQMLDSF